MSLILPLQSHYQHEAHCSLFRNEVNLDSQCFDMLAYACSRAKDNVNAQELWQGIDQPSVGYSIVLILFVAAGNAIEPSLKDCIQFIQAISTYPSDHMVAFVWEYMATQLNTCRRRCFGTLRFVSLPSFAIHPPRLLLSLLCSSSEDR